MQLIRFGVQAAAGGGVQARMANQRMHHHQIARRLGQVAIARMT
jgi:hypothetical protein